MDSTFDPRAATWRILLSLPGRVGIVDPAQLEEALRRVRAEPTRTPLVALAAR